MPDSPTPWVGLVALAAMFLLPLLSDWLFEGPRSSRHWLGRHVWADAPPSTSTEELFAPQGERSQPGPSWQLRRLFEALHGARAAIDPGGSGAVSRPGARSAHSAESNRLVHSAAWSLMCEVLAVPVVRREHRRASGEAL